MAVVILPFHDETGLADVLASALGAARGELELRSFPDGESYLRIATEVRAADVVIAGSLDRPDSKMLALYLVASTARDLGARRVFLATPYLPYMRQDARFRHGESLSAVHVARLLSTFLDGLVTLDPHLHRIARLDDVFSIPALAASAGEAIAAWIRQNVPDPVVIGPDVESEQWVSRIASIAACPFAVLSKTRRGDREVEIRIERQDVDPARTPVLVDDIISTARTMVMAVGALRASGTKAPFCVGVHALFGGDAHGDLLRAGAAAVVTCNTVAHTSNGIDIRPEMAIAVARLLAGFQS